MDKIAKNNYCFECKWLANAKCSGSSLTCVKRKVELEHRFLRACDEFAPNEDELKGGKNGRSRNEN